MIKRISTADRVYFLATIAVAELGYVLPLDLYLKLVVMWGICVVAYALVAAFRLDLLRALVAPTAALLAVGRVNAFAGLKICATAWIVLVACSVLIAFLRACFWLVRWFRSRPPRVGRTEAGLVSSAVRGRATQVRAEDVLAEMGFGPK